jgi:hypothetical protein
MKQESYSLRRYMELSQIIYNLILLVSSLLILGLIYDWCRSLYGYLYSRWIHPRCRYEIPYIKERIALTLKAEDSPFPIVFPVNSIIIECSVCGKYSIRHIEREILPLLHLERSRISNCIEI